MKKCAVVIGVDRTRGLPALSAAAAGAREFAGWAEQQGLQVALLTDADGGSVALRDVKKAVRGFVEARTFSQMLVFFAGHGLLRGPDYELWLLSDAPEDPDEAVNVAGSIWNARNAGLPHLVFISDTCRSRPDTMRLSQVSGGILFPSADPQPPRPAVDVFYATLPGDPALEAPVGESAANYRGLFTHCLLKGLRGEVARAIVSTGRPPTQRHAVGAWELKAYLEEAVPELAASISVALQQNPEIRVESHPPLALAEVERVPEDDDSLAFSPPTAKQRDPLRSLRARGEDLSRAVASIQEAQGRERGAMRTGFMVVGAAVARAIVGGGRCEVFDAAGVAAIRVEDAAGEVVAEGGGEAAPGRTLLVQLAHGSGAALAVLPGMIGTVVVEGGRVVTVDYSPASGTAKSAAGLCGQELEDRRAFVAVAARNGVFQLGRDGGRFGGVFLRGLKALDPTLGLYAAYAYAQAGDFAGIDAIYTHLRREPEPVLFDVALLAGRPTSAGAVAPFCPVLTQGWGLLGEEPARLPAAVRAAGRHLVPGLCTNFAGPGVEILWAALAEGALR